MPNKSNDRRIGFNIQYLATHVKQMKNDTDTAICVRGVDNYNNFGTDIPGVIISIFIQLFLFYAL